MTRLITILTLTSLSACSARYLEPVGQQDLASRSYADGTEEADLVLRAANELTFEELDVDAALDRRAAEGIVDLRPFATIPELDAVPYVGSSALDKLYDIAVARFGSSEPPLTPEQEDELVLRAANELSLEVLDVDVALDVRAAEGIVALRPFETVEALDAVPYVGASALDKLLTYALETWGAPDDCPEGVVRATTGAEYTDLGEAARRSPAGTVLTLCAGTYEVSDALVERDMVIEGQGSGRTVLRGVGTVLTLDRSDVVLRDLTIAESGDPYGVVYGNGGTVTLDGVSFERTTGVALGLWDTDLIATNGTRFVDNDVAIEAAHADITSTGTLFADNQTAIDAREGRTYLFDGDSFHRNDSPDGAIIIAFEWGDTYESATFVDVDFGLGETENAGHDLVHKTGNGFGPLVLYYDHLAAGTTLTCGWSECEEG